METPKKSLISAVLGCRCPRCREGSLFVNPRTYSWERFGENHRVCPVCGVSLQPEPGFYFGAAYVSWALTVALWISVLVALKVLDAFGWVDYGFLTHPGKLLITGGVATLVLFPWLFRMSRTIWAHFFITSEPGAPEPG